MRLHFSNLNLTVCANNSQQPRLLQTNHWEAGPMPTSASSNLEVDPVSSRCVLDFLSAARWPSGWSISSGGSHWSPSISLFRPQCSLKQHPSTKFLTKKCFYCEQSCSNSMLLLSEICSRCKNIVNFSIFSSLLQWFTMILCQGGLCSDDQGRQGRQA